MEREEDFVAALQFAEEQGCFQEINQISMDLGIKILIRYVIYDSLKTIIGLEIREDTLGYTVSKASLCDENGINYTLLGIKQIKEGYPFPWFLEFEPIMQESKTLTLTIEQLQSYENDNIPLVRINTIIDPWEPYEIDHTIIEKLEKWREELQAPTMDIPPTWECTGQWRYTFSTDLSAKNNICIEHPCYIKLPFLNQVLKISKVYSGVTGTLLICDSYHKSLDEQNDAWKNRFIDILWKSKSPAEFGSKLKNSGLNILRPMFFKLSLYNNEYQYSYPCTGSGPWGIFNTRFYYFSDCVEDLKNIKLRVEEVFNISLDEPWSFILNLKDIDQNKEIPFNLISPFVTIQGKFTVKKIHYDMEYILISHEIEIFTGNIKYLRLRDMKLIDAAGYEYQPLDKSSHWTEPSGTFIKALSFPPVHFRGSVATLEITSIDIEPIVPFELNLII